MKYCPTRKGKTLLMYRVYITKRPREIWQLDRSLNKREMTFSGYWMFTTFREYCLVPEEHTFEEETFLSLDIQRHAPIIWAKPNWISFDISLGFIYHHHHHRLQSWNLFFFTTTVFKEICRCNSWKNCTFIWLFWLCWWKNYSYL